MDISTSGKERPEKTITVMADHGFGPYAWLKDSSDETRYVGGNIADARGGFYGELPVSADLESAFASWVIHFENNCFKPAFNWQEFNFIGLSLSKQLYLELGGKYRVVYAKPCEDPSHPEELRIEVNGENCT